MASQSVSTGAGDIQALTDEEAACVASSQKTEITLEMRTLKESLPAVEGQPGETNQSSDSSKKSKGESKSPSRTCEASGGKTSLPATPKKSKETKGSPAVSPTKDAFDVLAMLARTHRK